MRNFEAPNRSLAVARNGMAATSHPLSTLAAVNILQAGGNAIDAAIAACAVQGVVEPGCTGIGGDCFALLSKGGSNVVIAFNGSGWAPRAATPDSLRALGVTALERQSAHSVTVPGAVDAWATLAKDHGTMPLGRLLEPAIVLAEDGFAVAPRAGKDWLDQEGLLQVRPESAVYLSNGKAPREGDVHRFPELAETMRAIGKNGPAEFYQGATGRGIVEYLQSLGGLHTYEDFAEFSGEYVTPIRTTFRGMEVVECPPNGQGLVALIMLKLLERAPLSEDAFSAERLLIEIDAARKAYWVRDNIICDPRHGAVDVAKCLSDEFLASLDERAQHVRPHDGTAPHRDTVYISVVDKDRNCVSFINSIFHPFGSGLVAPGGVLLQNRGQGFSLEGGHANVIGPRRRPMHTIIPGMLMKDGRAQMPFGVMGGHYQAFGHAHLVSKMVDYGMDAQSAIELPRVFPVPGTNDVEVESTVPEHIRDALIARGFNLVPPEMPIGGAQAIWVDWDRGVLLGGSDPRKDGCALGY